MSDTEFMFMRLPAKRSITIGRSVLCDISVEILHSCDTSSDLDEELDKASYDKVFYDKACVLDEELDKASYDKVFYDKACVLGEELDKASYDKVFYDKACMLGEELIEESLDDLSDVHVRIESVLVDDTLASGDSITEKYLTVEGCKGAIINNKQIRMGSRVALSDRDYVRLPLISFYLFGEYICVIPGNMLSCVSIRGGLVEVDKPGIRGGLVEVDKSSIRGGLVEVDKPGIRGGLVGVNKPGVRGEVVADVDSYIRSGKLEVDEFSISGGLVEPHHKLTIPRCEYAKDLTPIEVEPPPKRKNPDHNPILLAVGPALTMVIPICLRAGVTVMALSSVFAALWAGVNVIRHRRMQKKEERRRRREYKAYISGVRDKVRFRMTQNANAMHIMYPTCSEIISDEKGSLLWNRKESDSDYYSVRIGVGNPVFDVPIHFKDEHFELLEDSMKQIPQKLSEEFRNYHDVPVCLDLANNEVGGVLIDDSLKRVEILGSIILSVAASIPSDRMKIGIYVSEDSYATSALSQFRFLPHLWDMTCLISDNEPDAIRDVSEHLYGIKQSAIRDVSEHLYGINPNTIRDASERACGTKQSIDVSDNVSNAGVRYLIITDSTRVCQYVSAFPNISVLVVKNSFEQLPREVGFVLQSDATFSGMFSLKKNALSRVRMDFDRIPISRFRRMASRIAYFAPEDAPGEERAREQIDFYELMERSIGNFNIASLHTTIETLWKQASAYDSLRAPLGMRADGDVLYADFHEKGDGPHGLVAGMTGSGKSEMLQTIILSLALLYPPTLVGFLLIDYKGGGMAELFTNLPHVLGIISNLSDSIIDRAYLSLHSEVIRRQKLFSEYGVNRIQDYQRLHNTREILPHIFIVVDEFAELRQEEPRFMEQLISISRIGRSLGVHLILSTQKPAGVVDDKIRSNARFRICLRLQDRMDSVDMLHCDDAAALTEVGSAYYQVGNNEKYCMFQGAYTMAPHYMRRNIVLNNAYDWCGRKLENCQDADIVMLEEGFSVADICSKQSSETAEEICPEHAEPLYKTQLAYVVAKINEALKLYERNRPGGAVKIRAMWTPPLPEELFYSEIVDKYGIQPGLIGMFDCPQMQRRGKVCVPTAFENMAVIGVSGCGKSTFLKTYLYSLPSLFASYSAHVYIIDTGGGCLEQYKAAAFVGGYIDEESINEVGHMIMFLEECARKRKVTGPSITSMILIIDNYGLFSELTAGRYEKRLLNLMKGAKQTGVMVVITALNVSATELPQKVFDLCDYPIVMQMRDAYAYSQIMRLPCGKLSQLPQHPGGALCKVDDECMLIQVAIPPDSDEISHVIEKLNKGGLYETECEEEYKTECETEHKTECAAGVNCVIDKWHAPHFPRIPAHNTYEEMVHLIDGKDGLFIGYEEESGKLLSLPVNVYRKFVITGKSKSGRSNLLKIIADEGSRQGIKVVWITWETDEVQLKTRGISVSGGAENSWLLCELEQDYDTQTPCYYIFDDIGKWYADAENTDKEHMLSFAKNMASNAYLFVSVDTSARTTFKSSSLGESILRDAFGIHLGGCMDNQNYWDFSDIPFSKQAVSKPPGQGNIPMQGETLRQREVIIPSYEM